MVMKIKRAIKYWWQRRTRGWDDSEVWCLRTTFSAFAAPRLRRMAELTDTHPPFYSYDEWIERLNAMAWAFENVADDDLLDDEEVKEVARGIDYFRKDLFDLWW
jgi:hypothetical protein